MNPDITPAQIQDALPKVESGLRKYCWLQQRFRDCDVAHDAEFQTRFKGFYRVRRNSAWCDVFFALMDKAKRETVTFPEALAEILRGTGRMEASFTSKLVATADPNLPVLDSIVLRHFGLKLPAYGGSRAVRYEGTVAVYQTLDRAYRELLVTETAGAICRQVTVWYPWAAISDIKKVDLVLWQMRTEPPGRGAGLHSSIAADGVLAGGPSKTAFSRA